MMDRAYKPVGFFRAFFHLMAGMFLAVFVPLTSLMNGLGNQSRAEFSAWSLLYFLLLPATGVGLLATAFGAARWKVYVRRTAYVVFAFLVITAAGIR